MSLACVFPGQGSQTKGMGAALFERFADWTTRADDVLGYSIRELCVDDPRGELGLTAFTQPALFVVNAMTYRARIEDGLPAPSFVAGHSLGEYNALLAADVFDFDDGLRMVKRRGRVMGEIEGGGMAAIVGVEPAAIERVLAASEAGRRVDVANFNSFEQTVVAGPRDDLAEVKAAFEAIRARVLMLKVSAPFHSRYMREPMLAFAAFLENFSFRPPAIPVVANVTAAPYDPISLRETLARQVGTSVRWLESVLYLIDQGVTDFEEVGPGNVLTKLTSQIQKTRRARDAAASAPDAE